jgi:hypothetical protein
VQQVPVVGYIVWLTVTYRISGSKEAQCLGSHDANESRGKIRAREAREGGPSAPLQTRGDPPLAFFSTGGRKRLPFWLSNTWSKHRTQNYASQLHKERRVRDHGLGAYGCVPRCASPRCPGWTRQLSTGWYFCHYSVYSNFICQHTSWSYTQHNTLPTEWLHLVFSSNVIFCFDQLSICRVRGEK